MAQNFTALGLNDLVSKWSGANITLIAFSSGGQPYDTASGTFGTAANGTIDIASNIVLNLQSGETVEQVDLQVDGVGTVASVDGLNYVFSTAGTLTITSFELSLSN